MTALFTLMDFSDIAKLLPPSRVATIRKELSLAVSGDFDAEDEQRQPYQYQTQYWMTGALHATGVEYRLPNPPAKARRQAPDLILPNGASEYGVEVKRPSSRNGLRARLLDAHDQLGAWGIEGAVVVDITDLLRGVPAEGFAGMVNQIADEVNAFLVDETRRAMRPEFTRIMEVTVYGRGAWQVIEGERPQIAMAMISSSTVFALPGTLRDHRALWLRNTLQRALEVTARTSRERGEPSRWPRP